MNNPAIKSAVVSILVSLFLMTGCVSQNEVATIDNRLSELEVRNAESSKKSEALKSDLQSREGEEQALRHQAATLRQQIAALNEEIRTLTGRIEELEFSIGLQKQKEAKATDNKLARLDQVADSARTNDVRIGRIEQYLNLSQQPQRSNPRPKSYRSPKFPKSLPKMRFTGRQNRLLIRETLMQPVISSRNSSSVFPNRSAPIMLSSGSVKYITVKNGMKRPFSNIRR